jgi:hypothetical protein
MTPDAYRFGVLSRGDEAMRNFAPMLGTAWRGLPDAEFPVGLPPEIRSERRVGISADTRIS